MNEVLVRWNCLPIETAVAEILPCCGSMAWAREMANRRPFLGESALAAASDEIWRGLSRSDWMEAFRSHPRIGESQAQNPSPLNSAAWAMQEQETVTDATSAMKIALAGGNREYEKKFGHIFIVCATGKTAVEMLEILDRRLNNEPETELHEAAEQQRQITQIRLGKWLQR
jgi:2-oxo-4-hydroxy-4-carboxy-5-ureidoimidazoline decarboxylase